MRPRHKAAENPATGPHRRAPGCRASMRPRHKAAENDEDGAAPVGAGPSFNEAAA